MKVANPIYGLLTILLPLFISCNGTVKHGAPETGGKTDSANSGKMAATTTASANTNEPIAAIRSFIPTGYEPLDNTIGDLNRDAYPDMVLTLKKIGEDTLSDEQRPLLILLGNADGTYRLKARNDKIVLCSTCGGMLGDPYMGIEIKNGFFTVSFYGGSRWRWERQVTFRYIASDDNWYLHKIWGNFYFLTITEEEEKEATEEEKGKESSYTPKDFGKVPFEKYDMDVEYGRHDTDE